MVQMKFIVWLILGLIVLAIGIYFYSTFAGRLLCDINDPLNACLMGITEKARFLRYAKCAMARCAWGCGDERLNDLKLEFDDEPKTCTDTCEVIEDSNCEQFGKKEECEKHEHEGCYWKGGSPHVPIEGCFGIMRSNYCGNENDLKYELNEPELVLQSSWNKEKIEGDIKQYGNWLCDQCIGIPYFARCDPKDCLACPPTGPGLAAEVQKSKVGALLEGGDACGEGEDVAGTITFQRDYAREYCSYHDFEAYGYVPIDTCKMKKYDELKEINTFSIFAQGPPGGECPFGLQYRVFVCLEMSGCGVKTTCHDYKSPASCPNDPCGVGVTCGGCEWGPIGCECKGSVSGGG